MSPTITQMPYLSFSSQCRGAPEYRTTQAHAVEHHACQDPNAGKISCKVLEAQEKHSGLVKTYKDEVVHRSPTLDDWYYHFVTGDDDADKDKKHRDETQVVTKSLEMGSGDSKNDHWRFLRVDQLWMWTLGESMLSTKLISVLYLHKLTYS